MAARTWALCGLLLSAFLSSASAQGSCSTGGALDYFPANTTNEPGSWSRANQTAAGNTLATTLLPIALYGIPYPKLNFIPRHWTLRTQAALPAGCTLTGTGVAATRRLSATADQRVTSPARFTYSWQLDSRVPVAGGQSFTGGEASSPAPAIMLNLYDPALAITNGPHTLTINVTIAKNSGTVQDTLDGSVYSVPSADIAISQSVKFYVVASDSFLDATKDVVNMSSCSDGAAVSFNVSNLSLEAAALPNGSPLFQPVYYIYGTYNATFDGSAYDKSEDTSATAGNFHVFSAYVTRPLGSPAMLTYSNDQLVEGWYNVNVELAVTSDYPELMSLSGAAVYGQSDVLYATIGPDGSISAGASLLNKRKYASRLLPGWSKARVAVFKGRSLLQAFSGPSATNVAVGQNAMFNFLFSGIGNATCTIDGTPYRPDAGSPYCTSPLVIPVKDTANHTLAVTFTNICGSSRTEVMEYGFKGSSFFAATNATLDGAVAALATGNLLNTNTCPLQSGPCTNGALGFARHAALWLVLACAMAAMLLL